LTARGLPVLPLTRGFRALVPWQRAEHNVQVPVAQHLGGRIRVAVEGEVSDEAIHDLVADFFVGFLTAAKAQLHPYLKIVAEELDRVIAFDRQVVRIDGGRDLKLLHSAGRLAGMRILISLGFLVEKFAVVDDAADRRSRTRGDLDQVQAFGLSQTKRLVEGHDPKLLFGVINDSDFSGTDFAVAAVQRFAGLKRTGRKRAAQ